jgi:nucleotide-binding universal stress UspA family protein
MKKTILTPVDYSEVSDVAVANAAKILKASKGDLLLFHVVKTPKQLFPAQRKLKIFTAKVQAKFPEISVKSRVRIGDVYDDIGNAALENNAELIVMGTHGLKGFQIITGSRALKVVANSEVPIIIVQKKTRIKGDFNNILVPMTIDKNSKQKLTYAKHLASYFNSKIFLLPQHEKDEFLRNKVQRDINFSKKYFEEANIEYEVATVKESGDNFDDYIKYSKDKEIDLVVFLNQAESAYTLFDAKVQRVITNKSNIPVLLINPKSTSFVTIFGNYSGQG